MHLSLLKKYFFINSFEPNLIKCQDKNTTIIYRNYEKKNILTELLKIKYFCRKNNYKFFLANNIKLALNLGLDGAYLPSFNKKLNHIAYSLKKDFILLGSAHNLKEIKLKEKQKVKMIFLSSLFKKNKNYLGLNKFKKLSERCQIDVIALGGISKNNLKKISLLNIAGFAGITYFKKKAPY